MLTSCYLRRCAKYVPCRPKTDKIRGINVFLKLAGIAQPSYFVHGAKS